MPIRPRIIVWLACALAGMTLPSMAESSETQLPNKNALLLRMLGKDEKDLNLWWVRPTNGQWSHYRFYELTGGTKSKLWGWIHDSKFEDNAGEYFTLDLNFKDADELGQGFLVLEGKNGRIGLKFIAIQMNRQPFSNARSLVSIRQRRASNSSSRPMALAGSSLAGNSVKCCVG